MSEGYVHELQISIKVFLSFFFPVYYNLIYDFLKNTNFFFVNRTYNFYFAQHCTSIQIFSVYALGIAVYMDRLASIHKFINGIVWWHALSIHCYMTWYTFYSLVTAMLSFGNISISKGSKSFFKHLFQRTEFFYFYFIL